MTNILLLLFILLRPFYVRAAGQIQPADAFLLLYFLRIIYRDIKEQKLVKNIKKNMLLYMFLVLAIMINGFYHKIVADQRFLFSSLYLLYIGITVYSYDTGINRGLIDKVRFVLYANIGIQFLIYCCGVGRVFYEFWENGATRYMGTFTDPNQLGFYMFIILVYSYLTKNRKIDIYLFPISSILGIFLVIQSKSLSAILGLFVLYVLVCLKFIIEKLKLNKLIVCAGLIFVTCSVGYYFWPPADFRLETVEYTTVNRIRYKLYKVIYANGIKDILSERAAEKLVNYPEYLIYGAGEGYYERYYPEPVNEIHSSFINLFFAYGVIPFSLLIAWFRKRLKKMNSVSWICFISIIVESTFLVNYRQALFWIAWITLFYINDENQVGDSVTISNI
jgi:hypothetical protein